MILFIGATDTGKTTLCAAVARAAFAAGRRVAIVDADPGQSEIGPPTTVGLGIPAAPFARLSDLRPHALAFVGSPSPLPGLLEWAIGTRRLVACAVDREADLILVDLPGMISPPFGVRLHLALIDAIRPKTCLLLERQAELRAIRRGISSSVATIPIPVSPAAHAKTVVVRRLRRASRWTNYFEGARSIDFGVDSGTLSGGQFFVGAALLPSAMAALQQNVVTRILYVERGDDAIRIMTATPPSVDDLTAMAKRFGRRKVLCLDAHRLKGLVVGLNDSRGDTLALGLVERIDFLRRVVTFSTPWRSPEAICGIVWGLTRVGTGGVELDPLRHGEL